MDPIFVNAYDTIKRTILSFLDHQETDEEQYHALYGLSASYGELAGTRPPAPAKGTEYLLELYRWAYTCHDKLAKGDFCSPADTMFQKVVDFVDRASIADIQKQITRSFMELSEKNRTIYSNYVRTYQFWGQINQNNGKGTLVKERAACLKEHIDDMIWLYNKLADYRSKYILAYILNHWITFHLVDPIIEKQYPSYFDLDILPYTPNEVFVDLGVYVGDSIYDFINSYRSYQKIYGYEIDRVNLDRAVKNLKGQKNIDLRCKAVSDYNGSIEIAINDSDNSNSQLSSVHALDHDQKLLRVPCVTLDTDITEPITLLKMDIEGSEQAALRGAEQHIKNDRPKLAICTYHGNTPIWEIPRMIDNMRDDYTFYMRYNGGNLVPSEYVLICV